LSTNIAFMEGTASVVDISITFKFLHMFLLERMDKYWSIRSLAGTWNNG